MRDSQDLRVGTRSLHRVPLSVPVPLPVGPANGETSVGVGNGGAGPEFQEAFGAPAGCQQAPCSLGNVCEGEGMKPAPPSACPGDPLPPKNVRASASSPTRHTHRAWPAPKGRSPFQVAFGGTQPPRGVGRAEDWVAHSLTHPLMGFRLLKHFVRCEANLSFLVGHCRRD